jgi:hypothetical protein
LSLPLVCQYNAPVPNAVLRLPEVLLYEEFIPTETLWIPEALLCNGTLTHGRILLTAEIRKQCATAQSGIPTACFVGAQRFKTNPHIRLVHRVRGNSPTKSTSLLVLELSEIPILKSQSTAQNRVLLESAVAYLEKAIGL